MSRSALVRLGASLIVLGATVVPGAGQGTQAHTPEECPSCARWNEPRAPVTIFGNTYWVGTEGLGAILIASRDGHILIDGALPESAGSIEANIETLGFRVEDVELILNSHAHFDHAGGIAELQRVSGAEVAATPWSAATLERGRAGRSDPQYGVALPFPPVGSVRRIQGGDTLRVGDQEIVAHRTAGHTPGGTSWSWVSCEDGRCFEIVYADSQTPVSADDFHFSGGASYPTAVEDFERGRDVLERLECDILTTPHPGASELWERVEARNNGDPDALVDPEACRRYAEAARRQLERRLERERGPVGKGPVQLAVAGARGG